MLAGQLVGLAAMAGASFFFLISTLSEPIFKNLISLGCDEFGLKVKLPVSWQGSLLGLQPWRMHLLFPNC